MFYEILAEGLDWE